MISYKQYEVMIKLAVNALLLHFQKYDMFSVFAKYECSEWCSWYIAVYYRPYIPFTISLHHPNITPFSIQLYNISHMGRALLLPLKGAFDIGSHQSYCHSMSALPGIQLLYNRYTTIHSWMQLNTTIFDMYFCLTHNVALYLFLHLLRFDIF